MSEYVYTPMLDGTLRLVILLPGKPQDKVQVLLSQNPFSNEEKPEYEALSYVWGSTEDLTSIDIQDGANNSRLTTFVELGVKWTLNWRSMFITRNLEVALRHLRFPNRCQTLWIDAICIDQSNNEEKGKEIPRMAMIYESAEQAVIWLGIEAEDSARAVCCLSKIARDTKFDEEDDTDDIRRIRRWRLSLNNFIERLENNEEAQLQYKDEWAAIDRLFRRDWFTRLWVYQELHLASRATIIIGHDKISLDDFFCAFSWIAEQIFRFRNSPVSMCFNRELFGRLYGFHLDPIDVPMLHMLIDTKHLHCFDARDRFYAILGLPKWIGDSPTADYLKNIQSVYSEWTSTLLLSSWNLGLDTLDLCPCRISKSPSWVLDPSYTELPHPLFSRVPHCQAGYSYTKESSSVKGNSIGIILNNSSITIHGKFLDDVEMIALGCPLNASREDLLTICRTWKDQISLLGNYTDGGTRLHAFASILAIDSVLRNRVNPPNGMPLEGLYVSALLNFLVNVEDSPTNGYNALLSDLLPGRSFFLTKKGYMGLCPPSVRPGDRLFIAFGKSAPLVVERVADCSESYRLTGGECYIYGMMNLEAFLGPLPIGWSVHFALLNPLSGIRRRIWAPLYIAPGERTQYEDPRLHPLPSIWKEIYIDASHILGLGERKAYDDLEGKGVYVNTDMTNEDGSLRRRMFYNLETNEIQELDPRLSLHALQRREFKVPLGGEELSDMIELGKSAIQKICII